MSQSVGSIVHMTIYRESLRFIVVRTNSFVVFSSLFHNQNETAYVCVSVCVCAYGRKLTNVKKKELFHFVVMFTFNICDKTLTYSSCDHIAPFKPNEME